MTSLPAPFGQSCVWKFIKNTIFRNKSKHPMRKKQPLQDDGVRNFKLCIFDPYQKVITSKLQIITYNFPKTVQYIMHEIVFNHSIKFKIDMFFPKWTFLSATSLVLLVHFNVHSIECWDYSANHYVCIPKMYTRAVSRVANWLF